MDFGGSQYGSQANYGGGYQASQAAGSQGTFNSPGSVRPKRSMNPVTIQMVNNAHEITATNKFALEDGRELDHVTLVAQLVTTDFASTKTTYTLNDTSDQMNAVDWNAGEPGQDEHAPQDGDWVRVYGKIQKMGTKQITIFEIRKVIDEEEKRYHQLSIIMARVKHQKRQSGDVTMGESSSSNQTNQNNNNNNQNNNQNGQQNGGQQQQQQPKQEFGGAGDDEDLSAVQQATLNVFQGDDSDEGKNILKAIEELAPQYSANDVREAVNWLADEGHLYSTIDDEHFKTTA